MSSQSPESSTNQPGRLLGKKLLPTGSQTLSSFYPAKQTTMQRPVWVKNPNTLNLNSVLAIPDSPTNVLNETLPGRPNNWQTDAPISASGNATGSSGVLTKEGSGVPGKV